MIEYGLYGIYLALSLSFLLGIVLGHFVSEVIDRVKRKKLKKEDSKK